MLKGVTLLWALRSPCNLRCQYCYFGAFGDRRNRTEPLRPGELSYSGQNDVSLETILTFIASFTSDLVRRVFIAGGEPLLWSGTRRVIEALEARGSEIIVCTNGLPLMDENLSSWLVATGVNAISVSLDSHDPRYNDHWRIDPSGHGWRGVVKGIKTVLRKRCDNNSQMKVGVYSVISRFNIDHIGETGRFLAELGVDYFIIQPVSLAPNHRLYDQLSLDVRHYGMLAKAIEALKAAGLKIRLPDSEYLNLVLRTLTTAPLPIIRGCFGGRDLFFVEPDGSIWDCPSMYKIAETPPSQYLSIIGSSATQVFSAEKRRKNTDCSRFSQDCVNMWQLMAFDEILR